MAPKRNEGPIHARTWVNLENVMLRETHGTQKATRCVILLPGNVQNRRIHRDGKIGSGLGLPAGSRALKGTRFLFEVMEMF